MIQLIGTLGLFVASFFSIAVLALTSHFSVKFLGKTWGVRKKYLDKVTYSGPKALMLIILVLCPLVLFTKGTISKATTGVDSYIMTESELINERDNAKKNAVVLEQRLFLMEQRVKNFQNWFYSTFWNSHSQPKKIMTEMVGLNPLEDWVAPHPIYGGSRIKLEEFHGNLFLFYGDASNHSLIKTLKDPQIQELIQKTQNILDYDKFSTAELSKARNELTKRLEILNTVNNFHFEVIPAAFREDSEISVFGKRSQKMEWLLINLSKTWNAGKVYLESGTEFLASDSDGLTLPEQDQAKVLVGSLNVRKDADQDSPVIGTLKMGKIVKIEGKRERWLQVSVDGSTKGWVFGKFMKLLANKKSL